MCSLIFIFSRFTFLILQQLFLGVPAAAVFFTTMNMETLSSKSNPKIKSVSLLAASASHRREQSRFVCEGLRLCCDAAISGVAVEEAFVTPQALTAHEKELTVLLEKAGRVYQISEEISRRLSDTKTPQGVFAVCRMMRRAVFPDSVQPDSVWAAADQLQNPSNLGAVCRTAEALGLSGLLVGGGCDIYNPKTLRASMGSVFRLPVLEIRDLPEALALLQERGMQVLAGVPDASAVSITRLKKKQGCVLVVGNEGSGISEPVLSRCDVKVTIPMNGRAESLNAAAAASILMWELMRP